MGQILSNWRVFGASTLAATLIIGSYLFARGIEFPRAAQASGEAALLQAIAAKDSDGDGLPDWQEALYGTDAHATDTLHLGMTDAEAVAKGLVVPKAIADIPVGAPSTVTLDAEGLPPPPAEGTLTDAFTRSFLSFYVSARQAKNGTDLSEADLKTIASQTMQSLSSIVVVAPDYKSARDLVVAGSGPEALAKFAADAEAVFAKNSAEVQKTEVMYLKDLLERGDSVAAANISALAKSYRDTAVGLSALTVPKELAGGVLTLVNALMRKSEIASDLARVNDDPLAAILALEQYTQVLQSLADAFMYLGSAYAKAGMSPVPGSAGAEFIGLIGSFSAGRMTDRL
jgi:hypothetical protein